MTTYNEACRIIDEHTHVLGNDVRSLPGSSGSVLGEDLVAIIDSPPFPNSAVDGYGRRAEDLSAPDLPLAGEVAAGLTSAVTVPPGHCVRIFTGAPVPPEIAAISMQEDCRREGNIVHFLVHSGMGDHIRLAGSDFHSGDVLIPAGAVLSPASIGLAVSAGYEKLECRLRPRASVMTTGDELVSPGQGLHFGQIFNSNEAALAEALVPLTARVHRWHSKDDAENLRLMLGAQLEENDVLVTCGGVSVGDYDYLKEAFAACGVEQHFWQVAIKPGKPVYFGTKGKTLVFGLPGNPVSALVTFYLFVRPALLKMAGHGPPWSVPLQAEFTGEAHKKPGRMEFLRGNLKGGRCKTVSGQGSHQLAGLAAANCLIHFPLEAESLKSGDCVDVTPLNWDS